MPWWMSAVFPRSNPTSRPQPAGGWWSLYRPRWNRVLSLSDYPADAASRRRRHNWKESCACRGALRSHGSQGVRRIATCHHSTLEDRAFEN
ncbi:uncharacterized protein BJX67DRAFT_335111 [Aspergillus lucknowensis]|uniref:Uncharacterized protein n=1 Tax=Aspergillus lucknowensis TaxID=176173 RepID=A0ABR4L5Z1_9EURO